MRARLVGLSFAVAAGEAAYVPLGPRLSRRAATAGPRRKCWPRSSRCSRMPTKPKLGHHLKFDCAHSRQLRHRACRAALRLDARVLCPQQRGDAPRHGLDGRRSISASRPSHYEDVCGKGAKQITFNQVDVDRATEYAAEDADVTLQLHQALWPQLEALPRLQNLYETIEQPLVPVLYRMERTGVLVDRELLKKQSSELAARMLELQTLAHAEAGGVFNVDSPKQLQEILFGKLGIPVIRKTPTGQPSTAEDVLEELAATYPLPKLILEYRGIAKLKSTYTDKLPEQIDQHTGRIHTSYHQAVAATGRLSSSDPNLQNIPIRTPEGRRIRQAFVAPRRAIRWWPPIIRRSSCASWRICPAMRVC